MSDGADESDGSDGSDEAKKDFIAKKVQKNLEVTYLMNKFAYLLTLLGFNNIIIT